MSVYGDHDDNTLIIILSLLSSRDLISHRATKLAPLSFKRKANADARRLMKQVHREVLTILLLYD